MTAWLTRNGRRRGQPEEVEAAAFWSLHSHLLAL
jgi:hypothetical protein